MTGGNPQVRPLLTQAQKKSTASEIQAAFQPYFRKTLAHLERVFRDAPWPNKLGGANWASTAAAVRELGDALDASDQSRIEKAPAAVKSAKHNTGSLLEKYRSLESKR